MLQSALAGPRKLRAYGEPDAAALAEAYACGIVRNHPFVDGNERTAAVATLVFLERNGIEFEIGEAELVVMVLALPAGELSEEAAAV